MNSPTLAVVCALAVHLSGGALHAGDPAAARSRPLAAAVRAVFAAKCAACHGAGLAKPRGGFGYVLDLRRVAGNPQLVIPGKPDESELWMLLGNGEMPPPDAPKGPLNDNEKEVVRNWIAAGAPVAHPADAPSPLPGGWTPTPGAGLPAPPLTRGGDGSGSQGVRGLHRGVGTAAAAWLAAAAACSARAPRRGARGGRVGLLVLLGVLLVALAAHSGR
jgi:mono/diheme cytochrome c family protein